MNGWLKLAPSFRRISWARWLPRRAFSCTQVSLTQLSRLVAPHESPFIRRAISVSNIPAGTSIQQLLDLVHCGPLESAQLIPTESASHGARAIVSFLDGPSASRFALRSTSLTLAGQALTCAWVPYRPLDAVVATAVARDCARRCLLLYKAGDHTQERDPENDKWAPARLESYLTQVAGPVERLVIRDLKAADSTAEKEEDGARDAGKVQEGECSTEIVEVHFLSIQSAIRAHARIRADPLMMRVHVEYGVDRCDGDTSASLSSIISEPRPHHPTYFPPTGPGDLYRPFSTVTLRNLHPQTTLADLCKRIYGGPLYAIALREDGEADVSFFHTEDARDFYAGTMRHGFTVHGHPLAVEPRPEVLVKPHIPPKPSAAEFEMRRGDSYPLTELPTPMPLVYSRVIRLRVFGSVGYLPITRDKVVRDFGAFGEIESVWMHRWVAPSFLTSPFPCFLSL
ncbi:hypothetical protein B0H11DRAFT_1280937 [Mycena galericulata]|nr:hypothetical protein B0H11DRAFT_1280937 [Mycena galericulata]